MSQPSDGSEPEKAAKAEKVALTTDTMSLTEAAVVLGIHRNTVYKLARNGTLPVPVLRVGSLWKVSRKQLNEYIASQA